MKSTPELWQLERAKTLTTFDAKKKEKQKEKKRNPQKK